MDYFLVSNRRQLKSSAGMRKYRSFLGDGARRAIGPGATLEPLTWRFLIAEMAVSSDNVCAIVYAAISSISMPPQRARRAACASPW